MPDKVTTVPNPAIPGSVETHMTHDYGNGNTLEFEGGAPGQNAIILEITRKQYDISTHMYQVIQGGGVKIYNLTNGENTTVLDPDVGNKILEAWNEGKKHPTFPASNYAVMEQGLNQIINRLETLAPIKPVGDHYQATLKFPDGKHAMVVAEGQDLSAHGHLGANGKFVTDVRIEDYFSGHAKADMVTAHQDGAINVNGKIIHDQTLAHNIVSVFENAKANGQLDMGAMAKFEAQALNEAAAPNAPQAHPVARGVVPNK